MRKKDYESLLSFRMLSENEITQQFRVEIKTTKATYVDLWDYKISQYKRYGEIVTCKIPEVNLKSYCKDNNINTDYYFAIPICTKYTNDEDVA